MTVYNNIVSDITIQCENREYQLHMQVLRLRCQLSGSFELSLPTTHPQTCA
jgi:hypothetical protein